jgi:hypothetical protein
MKSQIYIEECGDDLTAHAIRCSIVAKAIGHEVTFRRSGIEITCYPQTYYVDLCRLFQCSVDYRKWRVGK